MQSLQSVETSIQQEWTFAQQIERITNQLEPFDFQAGYSELEKYNIKISADPSPQELIEKLGKVQQMKDRVTEMMIVANNILGFTERAFENAFDSQLLQRQEKTQKDREIACKNLYRPQYNLYCKAKEYFENCKLVMTNLRSKQETLSRQITVLQLQQEIAGGNFPMPIKSATKSYGGDSLEKLNSLYNQDED